MRPTVGSHTRETLSLSLYLLVIGGSEFRNNLLIDEAISFGWWVNQSTRPAEKIREEDGPEEQSVACGSLSPPPFLRVSQLDNFVYLPKTQFMTSTGST